MGVDRQRAAETDAAVHDERPALALLAEAQDFELADHREGEAVVDLGDVDVLGADARHVVGARRGLHEAELQQVGTLRDRSRRFGMALGHAHDRDQRLLQVARAVGAADDDGRTAVALEAAVEQAEGIGDHARGVMLLDRERLVHHHVAVEDRVLARDHGDLGEVPRRRAVELHVAARALGIELGRREHADRRLELGRQRELRELLQARARRARRNSRCGRPRSARGCRRRSPPPSPRSGWRPRRWRRPSARTPRA